MDKLINPKDYFSKGNTNCLKGIFAILVLLAHLKNNTHILPPTSIAARVISTFGYLSVGMFFFFSGYGLFYSYNKKGKNYIKNFFRNRFVPLYSFYVFMLIIYIFLALYLYKSISIPMVLQSLFFGNTYVLNGWYFQTIFILYLLFFLMKKFFPTVNNILTSSIIVLIYFSICIIFKPDILVYQSILGFVCGTIFCETKEKIDKILNKKLLLICSLIISFFGFLALLLLGNINKFNNLFFSFPCKMLSVCFFIMVVVLLTKIFSSCHKLSIVLFNPFTKLPGKYFCEIYIAHGFFIDLFHSESIKISNDYLYILTVIVCTVISALLIKPVHNFFINKISIKY